MKNRMIRRPAILGALLLGAVAISWAGDDLLRGSTLENCILEIRRLRPLPVGTDIKMEAQVYWEEYKDTSAKHYGTEFSIEVPRDSLLIFGDGDATSASLIPLQAMKSYVVRTYWNNTTAHTGGFYKVSEDDGSSWSAEMSTRTRGSYDTLGMFEEPTSENVNREDADPDKKRIRIWSSNRGAETAITLSDV